jgi:hypothetical protein
MRRSWTCLVAVVAVLLVASVALADPNSRQRVRVFAQLPDWSGIWQQDYIKFGLDGEPARSATGLPITRLSQAHPPYNAEWEARYQAHPAAPIHSRCGWGFPAIMDSPLVQFEIVVTPEQTLFLPVWLNSTRQIFTDGRAHPGKDDLWETDMGDSIGHWEGDTLVVDTIGRKAGPIADRNELSNQAHFVERIRLVGRGRLEDRLTVDDSVALSHPWQVTLTYHRLQGVDRLIPNDCNDNDRNPIVNGEFTIVPSSPK